MRSITSQAATTSMCLLGTPLGILCMISRVLPTDQKVDRTASMYLAPSKEIFQLPSQAVCAAPTINVELY